MFEAQNWSDSGAGYGFVYFENGDLYGFGSNNVNQLGLGHHNRIHELTYVLNDPDIIKIYVDGTSSYLLKRTGELLMISNSTKKFDTFLSIPI